MDKECLCCDNMISRLNTFCIVLFKKIRILVCLGLDHLLHCCFNLVTISDKWCEWVFASVCLYVYFISYLRNKFIHPSIHVLQFLMAKKLCHNSDSLLNVCVLVRARTWYPALLLFFHEHNRGLQNTVMHLC